ncbi:MAG: peptidoglycan-binding protein [Hyphomicrobiales bacterium]
MRDRQASAYHNPTYHNAEIDLELRAEEAAYMAGKSLEDWLHDIILEQSNPANRPQHNTQPAPQEASLMQTKDAVLESLANRVKALETAQDFESKRRYAQPPQTGTLNHAIHQAAENIGRNYDEDARILIEGIRARVRTQDQQSSPRPQSTSRGHHDPSADRLTEMLSMIERLEKKLNETHTQSSNNPQRHEEQQPVANSENNVRLARIEQQLAGLESHLNNFEHAPMPDLTMPARDKVSSGPNRKHNTSRRKSSNSQGRKALNLTMKTIADQQNNKNIHDMVGSDDANQHFLGLVQKLEELQHGTPNINDLKKLTAEFALLRKDIVDGGNTETMAEIGRLRDLLQTMQNTVANNLDGTKLETLEADINRIAEFLLKSPDLTKLPEHTDTMVREISRISDGLLAIGDKNSTHTREAGDRVVGHLENSLKTLRDDIVAQLSDNNGAPAAASADLENRIADLRNHIDQAMSAITGKVDGIEDKVVTAAQKLEQLQHSRSPNQDLTQQMVGMEERLVGAAKRLEQASTDVARSTGATSAMIIDAVTNKELKEELDTLGARLSDAIKSGERSAGELTSQELKNELGGLADHLVERLKVAAPPPVKGGVTDDALKNGLDGLVKQVTKSFANESSIMVNHIDDAISKLYMMSESQQSSLENIARQAIEKISKEAPQTSGGDALPDMDIDGLLDGIKSLQSSTETLSSQTESSFVSVQQKIEDVVSRLNEIEDNKQESLKVAKVEPPKEELHDKRSVSSPSPIDDGIATKQMDEKSSSYSMTNDEVIMERMRAHVKARHPDEKLIEPSADDVPLKPGEGKPELKPVVLGEDTQVKYVHEANDAKEIAGLDASDPIEPELDDTKKSKSDFILAARRAAQLAASEQVVLKEQEEQSEARSTLSSIRERINAVGKKTKQEKPSPEAEESKSHKAPMPTIASEPNVEKDLGGLEDINEELLSETPAKSSRVKILAGLLAVALIGAGYFVVQKPAKELIASLSGGPAVSENVSSSQSAISVPSINTTKQVPELPALPSAPVISEDISELEVHTSLENDRAIGDIASLDLGASGIDVTTTQAISPNQDLAAEPPLDPVLKKALEELPDEGISAKLADALIAGDSSAFIEVARRYGKGDIFQRDIQKSAFWYRQAAEKQNAVAQYRLGTLYEEGIGLSKDVNEARRWYMRASDNGNALAMHNIAVLYTEGAFGEVDFQEAFKWFERGAAYGIKDSQFNLGILYVRGLGVKVSLPQAYKWFDIVAKGGDSDAVEKRDDVAKALRPDQLEAVKKESAIWKKTEWIASANIVTPPPSFWRDGTEIGAAVLHKEQPNIPRSSPLVKEAQQLLSGLGFNTGRPDGIIGKRTKEAVRSFEYELGIPQTGKINQKLLDILKAQKI